MLQRLSEYRRRRSSEIRSSAENQTRDIVRGARTEARRNLHEAIARERARLAQGLRQAEARAELESRQRAQQETHTLLRHMWEHIAAALEARWHNESERGAWISAAMEEAGFLLAGRHWRIEHASELSAEERRRGDEQARAQGATDVEWQLVGQLRGGLRIRSPGACLDATIEGLLAERADVEAAFLSEYETRGAAARTGLAPALPERPSPSHAGGPRP